MDAAEEASAAMAATDRNIGIEATYIPGRHPATGLPLSFRLKFGDVVTTLDPTQSGPLEQRLELAKRARC